MINLENLYLEYERTKKLISSLEDQFQAEELREKLKRLESYMNSQTEEFIWGNPIWQKNDEFFN